MVKIKKKKEVIKMKKLVNHFNAITKNTKARPVLSQVNFNSETQMIECTDSYRLLQVKSKQPIEHTHTINLTTLETNEVIYPDLSRLVPTSGTIEFEMILDGLKQEQIKTLKAYKKERVHVIIDDDKLVFKIDNTQITLFSIPINSDKSINDFSMYFNPIYLFDCLNFLLESEKSNIDVYYGYNFRPLLFSVENEFNYLITPIRKR